ncbi:unnamed protein product [Didymodactylos carnosus]|uniref:Uncharacterized protein n=1 Tax=Didymodactylos carnosus TaxID=1234261 RepID=A0A8S2S9L3_9BILA|nr:unnamed protein product [Didymodactylos carnosus]CAF4189571.1 unnamed protein product [Didymodactylos carnosus]
MDSYGRSKSVSDELRLKGIDAKGIVVINSSDGDKEIAQVVKEKNWDGLLIGGGVRSNPEWLDRIVKIVNDSNPNVKIIDHNGPKDVENAIERHFNIKLPLST